MRLDAGFEPVGQAILRLARKQHVDCRQVRVEGDAQRARKGLRRVERIRSRPADVLQNRVDSLALKRVRKREKVLVMCVEGRFVDVCRCAELLDRDFLERLLRAQREERRADRALRFLNADVHTGTVPFQIKYNVKTTL